MFFICILCFGHLGSSTTYEVRGSTSFPILCLFVSVLVFKRWGISISCLSMEICPNFFNNDLYIYTVVLGEVPSRGLIMHLMRLWLLLIYIYIQHLTELGENPFWNSDPRFSLKTTLLKKRLLWGSTSLKKYSMNLNGDYVRCFVCFFLTSIYSKELTHARIWCRSEFYFINYMLGVSMLRSGWSLRDLTPG